MQLRKSTNISLVSIFSFKLTNQYISINIRITIFHFRIAPEPHIYLNQVTRLNSRLYSTANSNKAIGVESN